jgi:hypothetical protein
LKLGTEVPFVRLDARDRESVRRALIRLTEHALARLSVLGEPAAK